jgi:hypothetical protein
VNALENRVRESVRAVAQTVPDSAVPPLRLPRTRAISGWRMRRRWGRRLTPVAAAVAVIVVVALLVAVRGSFGPGTGASPPASGGVIAPQYIGADGVPPYYVAVTANANPYFVPSYAVVRDTTTGATLGTIRASVPGYTIRAVTGAADDRTFVLDEDKWVGNNASEDQIYEPHSFYLLRLNSDGRPASVTRLPMTAGPLVSGMALSADGTRLAIAVAPRPAGRPKPTVPQTQLRVYTLATGAVRTWSGYGSIGQSDDPGSISWTANGQQLVFDWYEGLTDRQQSGPWLLTLAGPSTSLLADSHQVISTFSPVHPLSCSDDQIVTPDGSAVICPEATAYGPISSQGGQHMAVRFLEYSTATGRLVRTVAVNFKNTTQDPEVNVLWSNAAGTVLIGAVPNLGIGWVGIINGSTFTPIPLPPNTHPYYLGAW